MNIRHGKKAVIGLALASLLALGGCYDDGYGYGGVSVGYGSGGYYDGYYGYPYGWYDGFYYPGRGYWIYDRAGHRHRWSDHHRRHWEGRREAWRKSHGDRNWSDRRDGRRDGNWSRWRERRPDADSGDSRRGGSWQGRSWRGGEARSRDGSRRGRDGGSATQRPAPGPMGHVFRDRGRRDR